MPEHKPPLRFSSQEIEEAEQNLDLSSRGTDEEYYFEQYMEPMVYGVINGDVLPELADFFVHCYLEDDGTWDVDVYDGNNYDEEYSSGHFATKKEAVDYAYAIIYALKDKGSVSFQLPKIEEMEG